MPEKNNMDKPGSPAGLRLLTKKDVARLLACSIRMVERRVASGTLPAVSKPKLTRTRIILAFAVSVIADVLQFPINAVSATGLLALPGEVADMMLDIVVMIITSALLGFHWALLPAFVLEAVPGLDLFPTWTGCVAFVVWRRKQAEAHAASIPSDGNVCKR
jgi:hypothetical protein